MKLFGRKKARMPAVHFEPETQYAVIRSSLCTGDIALFTKVCISVHKTGIRQSDT